MTTPDPQSFYPYIIYRCVMGSRAFGLDVAASDTDRRGIYLPPANLHWSLEGVPEQIENEATQETYWELQKFLNLALKANPNILECLYSPLVETSTPLAEELLAMRQMFLTRQLYQTFQSYATSQFRKLAQDVRTTGQYRLKHAMHLLRLLLSGTIALREGYLPVRVEGENRERLLAVRRGELDWPAIESWRNTLQTDFETAYATTRLPEMPDQARANTFLIKARRTMV